MWDDFRPTASIEMLKRRAELLKRVREFFDTRGFFEVETPLISHDTVVDRYIDPIAIHASALGNASVSSDLWLQTSPEFAMKRLMAAGAQAIYQITRAFRAGEAGARHNPEFTMLEWYRAGDNQKQGIALLGQFACMVFGTSSFDTISYQQLFEKVAGVDGLGPDLDEYVQAAERFHLDTSSFAGVEDVDQWRNLLLTEVIEPQLGAELPIIVYDWPASQSALAVCRDKVPQVAERFELYFRGTELANGYHELLDAEELKGRFAVVNDQRRGDGKNPLPIDSRLLQAMESGMPPCSGVAVGMDRLLMVLSGSKSISDVIAFPIHIA